MTVLLKSSTDSAIDKARDRDGPLRFAGGYGCIRMMFIDIGSDADEL